MKPKGMKQLITFALWGALSLSAFGQKTYTLDECRAMAFQNNVKMRNAANEVEAAIHVRKEASPTISQMSVPQVWDIMPIKDCYKWKWDRA